MYKSAIVAATTALIYVSLSVWEVASCNSQRIYHNLVFYPRGENTTQCSIYLIFFFFLNKWVYLLLVNSILDIF